MILERDRSALRGGNTKRQRIDAGNLRLAGNTLSSTDANGNINLTPNGTGTIVDGATRTSANQPAFLAHNSVTDSNVTGNGTVATVDFDTEIFDQGADFSGDTFTASITGRYLLSAQVRADGITAVADQIDLRLVTSNRSYALLLNNDNALGQIQTLGITFVVDMDASDTVTVTLAVTGEASDVVDILGGSPTISTAFSGCLLV